MSLHVHRSNGIGTLAARLAEVARTPVGHPALPECIVVQGRGMERWLAMRLGEAHGVWANPDFPFPRKLLRRAIEAALGGEEKPGDAFEPGTLAWVIAGFLPTLVAQPAFGPIAGYLADDSRGVRRFGLANRLAETFDQYGVFRPEMIDAWERGEATDDWQAVLWREIVARHGRGHVGGRIRELTKALHEGDGPIPGFPARVSVFGVSSLPPLYADALVAPSQRVEMHLFVLSPSAQYWGDIRSQREIVRELVREGREVDESALHLECGNPLLASLGRLGRDFQRILEAAGDYEEPGPDLYEDPGQGTMLATVQSDILHLRHRSERGGDVPPLPLDDADGTITVHACHGPMREVEVLHDQLLDLFERHPDLEARDVVVMSPAIDAYAPYVDAVFGRPGGVGRPQIPYHVADRAVRSTDEVIEAFSELLDVLRGRMGGAEVLDLLAIAPIREQFRIDAGELDVVREWAAEAGICWGIDGDHRQAESGVEVHENTWRFGLDRLVLGHAMRSGSDGVFAGVLPFGGVEGNEAVLGSFVEFCEVLFSFRGELQRPRAVADWHEALGRLLGTMIAVTRLNRDQHRRIRKALEALVERAKIVAFDEEVSLDVVRSELALDFERNVSSGAFLSRGVTFCALVPMRSIPFRVVCLLGMSDGAFPRVRRPLGFDRMLESRRPGDRSQRDDDRYLFLEAILSARERLYVSYVGHGIHDDAEFPPSVVVSELLDTLDESFRVPEGSVRRRVVVHHPLQPFSRRYFEKGGDARLFSYDPSYYASAAKLGGERVGRPPFLPRPLPPDPAAKPVVTLDELGRFLENPARGFVRRRLGLYMEDDGGEIDFRDPISPNNLVQWKIAMELIGSEVAGGDREKKLAALRAGGAIPHGTPGDVFLDGLRESAEGVAALVRRVMESSPLDRLVIDDVVGETRVAGVLGNLWSGAQLTWTFSKLTAKHEIKPWVHHLGLCLRDRQGLPRITRLVGREGTVVFGSVDPEKAEAILEKLLRLYRLGQTVPLPFFPVSARAFLEAREKGDESKALVSARSTYLGGWTGFAESKDADVALAFGDADPLAPGFRPAAEGADDVPSFGELARMILGDLLEYRSKE